MPDDKIKMPSTKPRDTRGLPDRTGVQARYDRYLPPVHSQGPSLDDMSGLSSDRHKRYPITGPNHPQMRAPTTKERLGDLIRSLYESVSKQPVARISDALGISNVAEMSEPDPSGGIKQGIMPGPPGNLAARGGLGGYLPTPEAGEGSRLSQWLRDTRDPNSPQRVERGFWAGMNSPQTPQARPMHSAVPPEFHSVEPNRFAPVDPNQMPPGQMEYLDPDMSPMMESSPQITTELGNRLRRLLGGQ